MATIIKSNKAVNDTNNIFPYVSDYGDTTQSLGRYSYERELAGSPVTLSEHNALKTLEDSLTTLGVIDKVIEFIPLMGQNLNSMMLKYKFKDNDRMEGINSLSTSQLDLGKGLNLAKPTGTMPAVNLKLKQKYLFERGHVSFCYMNAIADESVVNRTIFGVGETDADENNTTQFMIDSTKRINFKFGWAGALADDKQYMGKMLIAPKIGYDTLGNNIITREVYDNGVLADTFAGTVGVINSTAKEKDIYLGAKNGATASGTKFFYGQIRLLLILDGTIDALTIGQINTALQTFISQTGKTL